METTATLTAYEARILNQVPVEPTKVYSVFSRHRYMATAAIESALNALVEKGFIIFLPGRAFAFQRIASPVRVIA